MKLAIVGLNYTPEPTGIAVYTAGLADGLVTSDPAITIRVIAGYPHYPQWRVYDGYKGRSSIEHFDRLTVLRLRHFVPTRPRLFNRLAMELHFGMRAALAPWGKPDTLLMISPALFSTGIASLRARLMKTPTCIWVQDIYSLGVTESGTGGGASARALRWVEHRILGSATRIIVIHDRFRRYLVEDMGIEASRITVVRNWSHLETRPRASREEVRRKQNWDPDDIVVLHAGNMGAKQGLENVVDAAKIAEERDSRVRFVLVGDGNQRPALEAMGPSGRLDFIDPLAEDDFIDTLNAADILLVSERPGLTEMSVPSKLTSYFSTGLPVLAATDEFSVTAEEIADSGGGVRVEAADPRALVEAAEWLASDPARTTQYGEAGRAFSERLLSPEYAISAFREILVQLDRVAKASEPAASSSDGD